MRGRGAKFLPVRRSRMGRGTIRKADGGGVIRRSLARVAGSYPSTMLRMVPVPTRSARREELG